MKQVLCSCGAHILIRREKIVSEQIISPSYISARKELKDGCAKESGSCSPKAGRGNLKKEALKLTSGWEEAASYGTSVQAENTKVLG